MKFTVLIPLYRNGKAGRKGKKVSEAEMIGILNRIWGTFGGMTLEGTTKGVWVHEGVKYDDECHKVSVVCDNSRMNEAETLVIEIGRQLGQLEMFFQVEFFDGIRFLKVN